MNKIGRYEILEELGRGAMGVVYSAMDPLIGRRVAIKTIRLDTVDAAENRGELTRRLFREAQSAGVLSHPGIITIHDVGEQGNEAYIVMEYVDGRNLEDVLSSSVPQRSGTLLSILRQCAAALDYAHGKGIIHRDIKPSNIMICNDGVVKIADFGVAKFSASTSMTQAGLVLGTPSYMSPEQAQAHVLDGRSDQFSLAVIAYRVLAGELPFQGATLTAILTKLLLEDPQYDSSGLHPYLQIVFKKALAKKPQSRFPNCTDFVQDLESAYSRCKAEAVDGRQNSIERESKSAGSVAATPAAAAAEDNPPAVFVASAKIEKEQITSRAPEEKSPAASIPPSAPGEGIQPPRRKSPVFAWVASLAVIALAAILFFAIKTVHKQKPAAENPNSSAADTAGAAKPAHGITPAASQNQPLTGMASQTKPEEGKKNSSEKGTRANAGVLPGGETASKRAQPVTAANPRNPESGIITWAGKLEKNAILVIAPPIASVGEITGEFPGKPVSIEVDPPDVTIRQMPVADNGYKQLMLYSGLNRYTSITIRWKKLR